MTLVYHPAVAAVAPTPGVPGTAAQLTHDFNLGWNTGAVSTGVLTASGAYRFSVGGAVQGIVTGLNDTSTGVGYAEIDYAFYISHGKALIYEKGAAKTAAFIYSAGDEFVVQRRGPTVSYFIAGALVYTSLAPSNGLLVADISIYAGGDSVVNPSLTAEVLGPSGTGGGGAGGEGGEGDNSGVFGSAPSMLPMIGYAYDGTHSESTGRMQPLYSWSEAAGIGGGSSGRTPTIVASTMEPIVGGGSNYAYSSSAASFEPMAADAGAGQLTPSYAVSAGAFAYMLSAGHGLTGGTGGGDGELGALSGLAADHPYGESRGVAAPFSTWAGQNIRLNALALLRHPKRGTLTAFGTRLVSNSFKKTAVAGHLSAQGGGYARVTSSIGHLTISASVSTLGRAALKAARGVVTAHGVNGALGEATLKSSAVGKVTAYSGAVLSVRVGGKSTLTASGTRGSVGSAIMRLPLCRLVASATTENFGQARLAGPALRPVASGLAHLIAPGYSLVAYGSAVVAAVGATGGAGGALGVGNFEAYAMNMLTALDRNPQNQYDPDVNEVTHYTDYPFTQIVRFGAAYYGVAADGLYLLEGDTDAGAPIAWSFRTALMDAGSKQLKRVRSVYVGARLVSEVVVTLVVGEEQELTYNYKTPRSDKAQTYRQAFGKGVRTRYFALGVSDPAGKFIELDSLDFENEILERSI